MLHSRLHCLILEVWNISETILCVIRIYKANGRNLVLPVQYDYNFYPGIILNVDEWYVPWTGLEQTK